MKRVGSKLRRITLGRYPDLSLAEARAQARTMLADIRDIGEARRPPVAAVQDRAGPPGGRGVDRTRGIHGSRLTSDKPQDRGRPPTRAGPPPAWRTVATNSDQAAVAPTNLPTRIPSC
jgi:hypothetical protein